MVRAWWLAWALLFAAAAGAKDAAPAAPDPVLEARMLSIAAELRCLVCQNQTIADSHAGLAEDLRRDIREQLARGATDEQVVQYMTDRYGDFVLYKPPFKATTALLWVGPFALVVLGGVVFWVVVRRRRPQAPQPIGEPQRRAEIEALLDGAEAPPPATSGGRSSGTR